MKIKLKNPRDLDQLVAMQGVWQSGNNSTSASVSGIDEDGDEITITFEPLDEN